MDFKGEIIKQIANVLNKNENEIENAIEKPPKMEMGDFAFPCFRFSKELHKSPQEIANLIKNEISLEFIERMEVIGAYLNFFIKKEQYIKEIFDKIEEKKEHYGASGEGIGKKALIEHTSINPNASPHVGRARNALIGDSISRMLKFNGYDVEIHYFVNDIGKQISMLLVGIKGKENITFDELLQLYIDINQKVKEDPQIEQEVFENLNKLENGDQEIREAFHKLVSICIEGQAKIFGELNIHYDFFDYESDFIFDGSVEQVLKDLEKTGKLFEAEDGRVAINQEEYNLPMKSPVLVITRADKTSLYPLRDIAYSKYKAQRGADKNIIVLGEDQKLYFNQVAAALDIINVQAPEVVHYSFVLLPEGKMSTRQGTVVLLEDLMKEILEKAKAKLAQRYEEVQIEKAKAIGYGAIKYAILKCSNEKNVLFDIDKALSFEGDASPYIQYNYARIRSLLEKANYAQMKIQKDYSVLKEDIEFEIIKQIQEFPEVVKRAQENLTPNLIANYIYSLTKSYSSFYHDIPILTAGEEKVKQMRLLLSEYTGIVIKNALYLLGIDVIEHM